jgi:hypothetical protein
MAEIEGLDSSRRNEFNIPRDQWIPSNKARFARKKAYRLPKKWQESDSRNIELRFFFSKREP